MFITVNQDNRADEHVALRSMFEARKRVFVDLLKWDLPVLADRFEVDHFDDPFATYLIVTDGQGEHLASARLLPTTRPALLDGIFPYLVDGPVPHGTAIFEITRFCLSPGIGAGVSAAAQHSQSPYAIFTHVPGLKVVMPSNAYDAKGLLIQAIRDDDPVIFLEHKMMYDETDEVPDEAYAIPFGEANFTREGDDVTIVAFSRMVVLANEAADLLAERGIEADVIDPRTSSPLDEDAILESVSRTGRLVVVDEANPRCGLAADIAALVASRAFHALKAPVALVTAPHTPVPFSPSLEQEYLPSVARIVAAAEGTMA